MGEGDSVFKGLGRQIADKIKRDIWAGVYNPGEPVRERSIAEKFDVSRGPVRDALLQLTKEGLLVAEPNRGVRVRERVSADTRSLLVKVRRTMEEHALRRGFPEPGSPVIEKFRRNLEAFRTACESGVLPDVVELDMAFHRLILSLHPEDNLEPVWLPVMMQLSLPYSRHEHLLESYDEHHAVLEAIESGNRLEAIHGLKQNIR